jgi:hypothetical protein
VRHLDEATILAVRDDAPVGKAARAHLDACATCRAALTAARARADAVEHALTALDRPIEPVAAKAGVRARLRTVGTDPGRSGGHRRWSGRHLGRAAALLLVTAGAAAALPGSPLRSLWVPSGAAEPIGASEVESPPGPAAGETGVRFSDDVGIAVAVVDSAVHVVIRGADPGTDLSVSWTDQSSARVLAPTGSRFTYAAGRIEVDASRGAIRIELPRSAGAVSVEVDGHLYLQGSPVSLQITGPMVDRTDDSIRFQVGDA